MRPRRSTTGEHVDPVATDGIERRRDARDRAGTTRLVDARSLSVVRLRQRRSSEQPCDECPPPPRRRRGSVHGAARETERSCSPQLLEPVEQRLTRTSDPPTARRLRHPSRQRRLERSPREASDLLDRRRAHRAVRRRSRSAERRRAARRMRVHPTARSDRQERQRRRPPPASRRLAVPAASSSERCPGRPQRGLPRWSMPGELARRARAAARARAQRLRPARGLPPRPTGAWLRSIQGRQPPPRRAQRRHYMSDALVDAASAEGTSTSWRGALQPRQQRD